MEKIKIDNNKYQIFILGCPAYIPFNFASHSWVVLNKKGALSRLEVKHNYNKLNNSHLYINNQPHFQGINISFFIKKYFWKSKLLYSFEGDENSATHKMINLVENSKENYPYLKKYSGLGPNSNTYVQWILNQFPELKIKLPFNYIGRNYK